MAILLTDLISRVPPAVEQRVRRIRDNTRSVIQDALRAECRLLLRTPAETENNLPGAQVPVEIAPGHPVILTKIEFPDDFERIMLLGRYRTILEQAHTGASGMLKLRAELASRPNPEQWIHATEAELRATTDWAASLLKLLDQHDPLKRVLAVEEDFLGVYQYEASDIFADESAVNKASIRIYWGVVGLVSEWMGCSVEDLTIVVLTHELAHAYTQLGADINGRRWPAPIFAKSETGLKEGLAQYYTDRVLRRLERRYAGALKVYEAMLPGQPAAYRAHKTWVGDSTPEAVRRAMLEVRSWQETQLADFNRRLAEAQKELQPAKMQAELTAWPCDEQRTSHPLGRRHAGMGSAFRCRPFNHFCHFRI